jgi:hypothetical protein
MSRSSLSQFPQAFARTVQNVFRTRIARNVRVRKMVSILILKANSGANLNRPWLEHVAAAF